MSEATKEAAAGGPVPAPEAEPTLSAAELAAAIAAGEASAEGAVGDALARIGRLNGTVNAFTDLLAERALRRARAIDAARAGGGRLGALAGVPFAAKNLCDLAGLPTRAGSAINRSDPPAVRDAAVIERLEGAGAICLGATTMDEYAYGFTGENVHDGPARNPHAIDHMTGGSSAGSAAAVAAGLVPFAVGSDTNGSIRVPASFCGLYGLKPTYGRVSRARTFPFVASLDHLGPLARTPLDLALAYDAMQGPDFDDPACAPRPREPVSALLNLGADGLRVGVAGGHFAGRGNPEAFEAVARCTAVLGATQGVEFPEAERARAAAFLITATEGASLHLDRLRGRPGEFDPAVRDRLVAGAMTPAAWVGRAQRLRRWFLDEALRVFQDVDVVLAPSTPCRAPRIGEIDMDIGLPEHGLEHLSIRAHLGLYTQPISFIGLPAASVPVWTDGEALPIGVQVIAAPWREDLVLRVAATLEAAGVTRAPVAML